jgi:hypothetical protein
MIKKDSIVPAGRVNRKELILSTILKVYAIREEVEERARENRFRNVPLLGDLALKLSSTSLTKSQYRDAAAFITATCTTRESLVLTEQIADFKSRATIKRPAKMWLSYAGLALPLLLVIAAEAYMFYINVLAQMPYLAIAAGLVILAVILSVLLFAYLGYDPVYRRDLIEKAVWRAMHDESVKKLKKSGVIKSHVQLTPKAKASVKE